MSRVTEDLIQGKHNGKLAVVGLAGVTALVTFLSSIFATKDDLAKSKAEMVREKSAVEHEVIQIKAEVKYIGENSQKTERKVDAIDENLRRLMRRQRVRPVDQEEED